MKKPKYWNPSQDLSENISHANRSLEYMKYLNQIEDNRSRGIMVLNGLTNALLIMFVGRYEELTNLQEKMLLLSLVFSAGSLAYALRIFWPKTDDADSQIHHTGIRNHKTWMDYSKHVRSLHEKDIVDEICRESWVVSGIVRWRGEQIKWASLYFVLSLVSSLFWVFLSSTKLI